MLMVNQLTGFGVVGSTGGNDSYTKSLLHFNGADTSTTITDSNVGGSAKTWTARGDAQIDTAIAKFGGAAGLFDGTGDWVDTPDHADFTIAAQDFVAECWFNFAGSAGTRYMLFGQSDAGGSAAGSSIHIEHRATNVMRAVVNVGAVAHVVDGTTAITTTGWHWVALVKSGTNIYIYLDGTKEATTSSVTGSINDVAELWRVGANNFSNAWIGSIDEFRLSVGTDRGFTGATIPVPTIEYF